MNLFRNIAEFMGWVINPIPPEVGSYWVEKDPMITRGRDPIVFKVTGTGPSMVDYCISIDPRRKEAGELYIDSPCVLTSVRGFLRQFKPLVVSSDPAPTHNKRTI